MANATQISDYTHNHGGRVAILFLLFFLALYQFYKAGVTGMAMVCFIPVFIIAIRLCFQYKYHLLWFLMIINYIAHFLPRTIALPIPTSLPNELIEIMLLIIAMVDLKDTHFERTVNLMNLAVGVWCTYCVLEVLNDTCDIGINVGVWFTGARMMAFQLIYVFLVFTLYIHNPKVLNTYLRVFAYLSLFGVAWALKQKYFGFTAGEMAFLNTGDHMRLHMINGVMRYFSVLSDAANFGCCMASTSVAFYIFAITTKVKRDRILYIVTALATTWGMFASGTRTAIIVLMLGFIGYVFLSKSFKIAVPVTLVFATFIGLLAFTNIGNGNAQIRRMRSAFDRSDASLGAREYNKSVMRKYMKDAPFGIGIGLASNVPANNKYRLMATVPPDSEYVNIWIRTGQVGITTFLVCIAIIILGASWVVLFRLHNPALRGIGAGLTCAFLSIQIGAYANQVLLQFPNCLLFFGGAAVVYVLPFMEEEYEQLERERLAEQAERERLKLEKKKASRV